MPFAVGFGSSSGFTRSDTGSDVVTLRPASAARRPPNWSFATATHTAPTAQSWRLGSGPIPLSIDLVGHVNIPPRRPSFGVKLSNEPFFGG